MELEVRYGMAVLDGALLNRATQRQASTRLRAARCRGLAELRRKVKRKLNKIISQKIRNKINNKGQQQD